MNILKHKLTNIKNIFAGGNVGRDEKLEDHKNKLQRIEGIIMVFSKNFENFANSVLEMAKCSTSLGKDITSFYKSSKPRKETVAKFVGAIDDISVCANDIFHIKFIEISQLFNEWQNGLHKIRQYITKVEKMRKNVFEQNQKLQHLKKDKAKRSKNGKPYTTKESVEYANLESQLRLLTHQYSSSRKTLEKYMKRAKEQRFSMFDKCFVRLMELQKLFFEESMKLSKNYTGEIQNYRARYPRKRDVSMFQKESDDEKFSPTPSKQNTNDNNNNKRVNSGGSSNGTIFDDDDDMDIPNKYKDNSEHNGNHAEHESEEEYEEVTDEEHEEHDEEHEEVTEEEYEEVTDEEHDEEHDDEESEEVSDGEHPEEVAEGGDDMGNFFFEGTNETPKAKKTQPKPVQKQKKKKVQKVDGTPPKNNAGMFDFFHDGQKTPATKKQRKKEEDLGHLLFEDQDPSVSETTFKAKPKDAFEEIKLPGKPNTEKFDPYAQQTKGMTLDEKIKFAQNKKLEEKHAREKQEADTKDEEFDLDERVQQVVNNWVYKNGVKKDIRGLLSTLHIVAWEGCSWMAISFTDLVKPTGVRKGWLKAARAFHPDKINRISDTFTRMQAKKVFNEVTVAYNKFRGS